MSFSALKFTPFPSSDFSGAVVVNVFAVMSTLAVLTVVLRITWLAVRALAKQSSAFGRPREFVFFHSQLGYYVVCLLIADLVSNGSGLVNLVWLAQGGITEGPLCNIQAITMQISNVAAAYFTVAISLHTFITLVLRRRQSVLVGGVAIAVGWMLSIGIAFIPLVVPDIYGVSGISCGVRPSYSTALFFYHLFPIFMASFFSAFLYALIYLVLRGTLVIRGGISLRLDPQEHWGGRSSPMEEYHRFVSGIARALILFPIAYVILLVPYSVTRLFILSNFNVPFQALVFASVCWFMIGVVNVGLLYNTFRVLGPVMDVRKSLAARSTSESPVSWQTENKAPSTDLENNIPRYPSPTMSYNSADPHRRSMSAFSLQPQTSSYIFHSRNASEAGSFIGRPISPASQLSRSITDSKPRVPSPAAVAHRAINGPRHSRTDSTDSMGLPAAPRYTRSEVTRDQSYRANSRLSPVLTREPPTSRLDSSRRKAPMPHDSFGAPSPKSAASTETRISSYPRSSYFETYYGTNSRSLTGASSTSPITPTSQQQWSPVAAARQGSNAGRHAF